MKGCSSALQVVADIDNDLEVGVFLGAYRQLAQRQDLETRRLCAESCAAVLKAATPRRSSPAFFSLVWMLTAHGKGPIWQHSVEAAAATTGPLG